MSRRKRSHWTGPKPERACLVGVRVRRRDKSWKLEDSVAELDALARAAGANPVATITQALNAPSPTYVGSGKLEEIEDTVGSLHCETVICDDELTPAQQRVLEDRLKVKVIDRTALILDIFAGRARTREGKLQVELAQVEYLMPRLAGQWSHLERLGGGIGTRGPGESQIETDRRLMRLKARDLRRAISSVRDQRGAQRRRRVRGDVRTVSLVGYTNAGKSALFNTLTGSDIRSIDRPFETLDTTTRRLYLPSGTPATLSDTVGFINKLPPILIDAFNATLEEAMFADLLVHVTDISNPLAAEAAEVVDGVLDGLGLGETPRVLVLNKLDLVTKERPTGDDVSDNGAVMTSAVKRWGIDELRFAIDAALSADGREVVAAGSINGAVV
ncbi:MAG: GTPase HflX [Chloroflexi bacterium]|nr:GTPase HflX [Chloroflexota bacterium]